MRKYIVTICNALHVPVEANNYFDAKYQAMLKTGCGIADITFVL